MKALFRMVAWSLVTFCLPGIICAAAAFAPNAHVPVVGAEPGRCRQETREERAAINKMMRCVDNDPSMKGRWKAAKKAIEDAIKHVPNGRPDPPGLRAILWALKQLRDNERLYGYEASLPGLERVHSVNTGPKCNYFVAYAYAIGAGKGFHLKNDRGVRGYPTKVYHPWWNRVDHVYPLGAAQLASSAAFTNLAIVQPSHLSSDPKRYPQPSPGDIVSFQEQAGGSHTTLALGGGNLVISARGYGIKIETIEYLEQTLNRQHRFYENIPAPHNTRRWVDAVSPPLLSAVPRL